MYQVSGQLPAKPSFVEAVRLCFDPRAITLAPTYSYDHHYPDDAKSVDVAFQEGEFDQAQAVLTRFSEQLLYMSGGAAYVEGPSDRAVLFLNEQEERIGRMKQLRHFREIGVATPVDVIFVRGFAPYICIETGQGVEGLTKAVKATAKQYIADTLTRGGYNLSHRNGEIMVDGEGIFQVYSSSFSGLENQVVVEMPPDSMLGQERLASLVILHALGKRIAPVREFHPDWRSNASNKN